MMLPLSVVVETFCRHQVINCLTSLSAESTGSHSHLDTFSCDNKHNVKMSPHFKNACFPLCINNYTLHVPTKKGKEESMHF